MPATPDRRTACLAALALAFMPGARADEAGLQSLRYLTEDYAPSNYVVNGQLTGYAVELLRAVWRQAGVPEQPIQVVPWARGYLMVQNEPRTVLFAMARTPEREALFKWAGPVYQTDYQLLGLRRPDARPWTLAEALAQRVGAIRGDQGQTLLEKAGLPAARMTLAADGRALLRMLKARHLDAVCLTSEGMSQLGASAGLSADELQTFGSLSRISIYYAFHRDTPKVTIERFQAALDALDGERRQILARYQLSP